MAWMGRGVSACAVFVALIVGIFWDQGISDLGAIQFPLTMQGVPTFLFALFATSKATDVHPWCLVTSAWVAIAYVFGVYFGYLRSNDDPAPIDAGLTGIMIQIVLLVLLESTRRLLFSGETKDDGDSVPFMDTPNKQETSLWYPNRPSWDIPCTKRFGDRPLTPPMLWSMMEGVHEPMTNSYFVAFMLFSVTLVTPLVPSNIPTSLDDVVVINGMPWWAMKALLLCLIPYVMSFYAVLGMPNAFPSNSQQKQLLMATSQEVPELSPIVVDPANVMELSREEMGRRTSYDETNSSAVLRRNSVRKSLSGILRTSTNSNNIRQDSYRNNSNNTINTTSWSRIDDPQNNDFRGHGTRMEMVEDPTTSSSSRDSEDIDC